MNCINLSWSTWYIRCRNNFIISEFYKKNKGFFRTKLLRIKQFHNNKIDGGPFYCFAYCCVFYHFNHSFQNKPFLSPSFLHVAIPCNGHYFLNKMLYKFMYSSLLLFFLEQPIVNVVWSFCKLIVEEKKRKLLTLSFLLSWRIFKLNSCYSLLEKSL